MTQLELGKRMRLSRQFVQKIESCEIRLDLVRYVTLCKILGLNAGQLLGQLEEPSDEDDFSLSISCFCARKVKRGHLVATFRLNCVGALCKLHFT
jgi:transcriptional regulator with XRE-family HTH domain